MVLQENARCAAFVPSPLGRRHRGDVKRCSALPHAVRCYQAGPCKVLPSGRSALSRCRQTARNCEVVTLTVLNSVARHCHSLGK
eukprot:3753979-Alexandrium_andersonii.AAC.1